MLKIKNNDIYLNRGEVCEIGLKVWNEDGTPFILPPTAEYIGRSLYNIAEYVKYNNVETAFNFYTPVSSALPTDASKNADFLIFAYGKNENSYIRVHTMSEEGYLGYKDVTIGKGLKHSFFSLSGERNAITSIHLYDAELYSFERTHLEDGGEPTFSQYFETEFEDTLVSVLAFTVRSASSDSIVFAKYLNLHTNVTYNGKQDHWLDGWNKFTTQEIIELGPEGTTVVAELVSQCRNGNFQVVKYGSIYAHLLLNRDGTAEIAPYEFSLEIPLLHEDTDMSEGEYTYDVIIYQGTIRDLSAYESSSNEFPLKDVRFKKEVIPPHKFVIGGSHNA